MVKPHNYLCPCTLEHEDMCHDRYLLMTMHSIVFVRDTLFLKALEDFWENRVLKLFFRTQNLSQKDLVSGKIHPFRFRYVE